MKDLVKRLVVQQTEKNIIYSIIYSCKELFLSQKDTIFRCSIESAYQR